MRRLLAPVAIALTAGLAAASAPAAAAPKVPQLIFPVVGKATYFDDFGAARGQGGHQGNDLMTTWRSPAVAVEAGKVKFHTTSARAGCMLYLYGASGTTYLYIHLNNDLTAKNDNMGKCVAGGSYWKGLKDGARVEAGQPIAYNGNSGDADHAGYHLHFEVHPGGGSDTNPFQYLRQARKPLFAAKPGSQFSLGLRGKLVSAGAGAVSLELERVRHYPGGRWLDVDARTVELAVPADADVAPALAGVYSVAKRQSRTALPVVAHTVKARATIDAIIGSSRALTVGRVAPAG
jgi:hypothetical protein